MRNTIDKWVTTATIYDEPRRNLWKEIFPDARLPIESIFPKKVNVPKRGECEAYMLDLAALTGAQIEGVCSIISKRFKIRLAEVRLEIITGVPIIADGVVVSSSDQGLLFSLTDLTEADTGWADEAGCPENYDGEYGL